MNSHDNKHSKDISETEALNYIKKYIKRYKNAIEPSSTTHTKEGEPLDIIEIYKKLKSLDDEPVKLNPKYYGITGSVPVITYKELEDKYFTRENNLNKYNIDLKNVYNPNFEKILDKYIKRGISETDINKLSFDEFIYLLRRDPQIKVLKDKEGDEYDRNKLWEYLYCWDEDFDIYLHYIYGKQNYRKAFLSLLLECPEIMDDGICLFESDVYWQALLEKAPHLTKYVVANEWGLDTPDGMLYYMKKHPLGKEMQNNGIPTLLEDEWRDFFASQPLFLEYKKNDALKNTVFKKIEPYNWVLMLCKNPLLKDSCKRFPRFDTADWAYLLSYQPLFVEKCKKLKNFSLDEWAYLLSKQPDFKFDFGKERFSEFSSYQWIYILTEQPDLAEYCNIWDDFSVLQWRDLLVANVNFKEKCNAWESFNMWDWCVLLRNHPKELKDIFIKYKKWNDFSRFEWQHLLIDSPQFIKYCNISIKDLWENSIFEI